MAREGGLGFFFSFDLLKGDGRGKRLIFLQNSLWGVGGVGLDLLIQS